MTTGERPSKSGVVYFRPWASPTPETTSSRRPGRLDAHLPCMPSKACPRDRRFGPLPLADNRAVPAFRTRSLLPSDSARRLLKARTRSRAAQRRAGDTKRLYPKNSVRISSQRLCFSPSLTLTIRGAASPARLILSGRALPGFRTADSRMVMEGACETYNAREVA
jgi:hypothetical protein